MNSRRTQVRVINRSTGKVSRLSVPASMTGKPAADLLRQHRMDPEKFEMLRPGERSGAMCDVYVFDLPTATLVLTEQVPVEDAATFSTLRLLEQLGCDPACHEAVVRMPGEAAAQIARNTEPSTLDAPKGGRVGLLHLGALGDVVDACKIGAAIRQQVEPAWLALYIEARRVAALGDFALAFRYHGRPVFDAVLPWAGGVRADLAREGARWDLLFDFRPYVGRVYRRGITAHHLDDLLYNRVYDSPLEPPVNALQHDGRTVHELGLLTMGLADIDLGALALGWKEPPQSVVTATPYLTMANGADPAGQTGPQTKMLPIEVAGEVAQAIAAQMPGVPIYQVGKTSDPPIPYTISLLGRTTLPELTEVLRHSRLHIACEGGTVRLAHVVGTRSVVIFGPTSPSLYGLPGNAAVTSGACEPCFWKSPQWRHECPHGWGTICMAQVSADAVVAAALHTLETDADA